MISAEDKQALSVFEDSQYGLKADIANATQNLKLVMVYQKK